MPDRSLADVLGGSARELYRKVLGVEPEETDPGVPAVFDGAGAVARVEGAIARTSGSDSNGGAGLGSTFPADLADRVYDDAAPRPAGRLAAGSGRGSLAAALGLASAGVRATAFLSGPDLLRAGDLLTAAARRRLPLVVHLADREPGAVGGGHAALHAATRAGAAVLVAADVQEAADLAVAGRRLAEDALIPVVVAMDGIETARSVQGVLLPTGRLLRAYLGNASEIVHPVTRSQELLHGRHRRRLLRWHDPSRPMTTGALQGPEAAPLAAAGRRAYLDVEVPGLLETALADLSRRTGRVIEPVTTHRVDGAKLVLVAVGAAVGTAEAAADALRGRGLKVGVIGLRALAPFPEARLAELFRSLRSGTRIAVLERTEAPFDDAAPLVTRLRALAAAVGGRHELPRPGSVLYGLGGAPLRGADLAELARRVGGEEDLPSPLYLGVSFASDATFPKREVLLDALSRSHPDAEALGLRGTAGGLDLRPEGSTALALHRVAGVTEVTRSGESAIAADAARLLHAALAPDSKSAARVLSCPGFTWERWAAPVTDRLMFGGDRAIVPGPDVPVDLAAWCTPEAAPTAALVDGLVDGGTLLIPRRASQDRDLSDWWTDLPAAVRDAVGRRGVKLYVVEAEAGSPSRALLLGALLGTLRAERRLDFKDRKVLDAWREHRGGPERIADAETTLSRFQAGLDRAHRVTPGELTVRRRPPEDPDPVPAAVRRLAGRRESGASETVDSLPRFWDQVGVLYRRGEEERLTPDPYIASGAVPQLAGSLRRVERGRTVLPAFDPAACTGCGDCWTSCPDGAIAPVVIAAGRLLDHAMGRARKAGESVDALRMAASQIAAGVHRELAKRSEGESGGDAAELFAAAFDRVVGKMPESRREPLREAFAAVRKELTGLPVGRTEPFFDAPEGERKGAGELFLLAVDPDACKGCGVCVVECGPDALSAAAADPVRTRDARRLWRFAEELPDPPEETIERARSHPEVGSLAGATLPKASRETVAAADGADAGSGSALAVRQSLAAAAFHLRPLRTERLAAVDALREELAGAIHEGLARALPDRDLDALAEGLGALERPEADLSELTGRVERALEGDRVDVARLRRLVDVARRLSDLRFRVGGAEDEKGRPAPSVLGLVLSGRAAAWGGTFPYSPFAVPVTVDSTGDGAGIARGLLEGSLSDALALARAVRRARIELAATTPSEAVRAAEQVRALEDLSWRDLDPAERSVCPPVLLVADEDDLPADDAGGLAGLLADDLPVKVLLLSGGAPGALGAIGRPLEDHPDGRSTQSVDDPVLGWAGRSAILGAWIAQTSVGAPDHLEGAVAGALAFDGPALVRIHAPEPARHGFPASATVERARRAIDARACPLYISRPPSGDELGDRGEGLPVLDLAGNPEPEAGWVRIDETRFTPADWAVAEARFAAGFGAPLGPDDPRLRKAEPTILAEYLELALSEAPSEREGRIPVVETESGSRRPVEPALVRAVEERLRAWRLLQRWASADRAFAAAAAATEQQERIERMEQEHRREVEALRADYERRLAEARATTQAEMARRVREKLLALAARRVADVPDNGRESNESSQSSEQGSGVTE